MLKSIKISNYKTFIEPTEIEFIATNYKFLESENVGNGRTVKGAIFVGENASGKTNILKAIRLIIDMLFGVSDIDFSYMKSLYTTKESFDIEYVFVIENKEIRYNVAFSKHGIMNEKLFVDDVLYLHRHDGSAQVYSDSAPITVANVAENLPFLRKFYFDTRFNDNLALNKWFSFLKESIYINCYDGKLSSSADNVRELLWDKFLEKNGVKQINDFFKSIGYRQQISYSNETHNKKGFHNTRSTDKFVSFKKDQTDIEIPIMYESTGNSTLVALLPSFIHAIDKPCMLIIDEFSSGFHNELEECLLKYFYHFSKNSQIFLATHSTNVLNNAIIRPDQAFAVSFNGMHGTTIKRFSDESPREAQNLEKMYLNGVFDGKPYYKKNF